MIRNIFKLLLWTVCALELASSHPTTVNTQIISSNGPTLPEENLYQTAAIANGMDPVAVAEVLKTKTPFVKVETGENGLKRTTTYKLEPDGSISRHTLTEYRPQPTLLNTETLSTSPEHSFNAWSNVPSTGVTPMMTNQDWEWNPTNVPRFGAPTIQTDNQPHWKPTWITPRFNFDQPTFYAPEARPQDTTTVRQPESWDPKVWPNVRPMTGTEPFNGMNTSQPGTVTKTFTDDDGRTITTVHTVGPTQWTTRTYSTRTWPDFNSTPSTTTARTPMIMHTTPNTAFNPLPSLDDFLKTQYGTTTKKPATNDSKNVTTINIDDLPILKVLNNSKPLDPINDFKVENVPLTQVRTITRTVHGNDIPSSFNSDSKMKEILEKAGISPEDILNAKDGTITKTRHDPDGKIVTTTYRVRTLPSHPTGMDTGSTNSLHSGLEQPQGPFFIPEASSHSGAQFPTTYTSNVPHRDFEDFKPNYLLPSDLEKPLSSQSPNRFATIPPKHKNPIDDFLAKLNFTAADITASNGELIKTIIDDDGRVLTARFVLSTVRNTEESSTGTIKQEPIK